MGSHDLFHLLTATIALSFLGLGLTYLYSFRMPPKGRGRRKVMYLGMATGIGFLGMTAYVYALMAVRSVRGTLNPLWYNTEVYVLFGIQAVLGLAFWAFATFALRINVYDKHHYEQVLPPAVEGPVDRP